MTLLAKIHIAKKDLGLEDDDYRTMLSRVVGTNTAKGLSDNQCLRVLEEFARLGWKPKVVQGGKRQGQKSTTAASFPSAKKARALWISLWQLGAVRNRSEIALSEFAKRQLKCDHFAWADQGQVYKLIEALKAMAGRNGWRIKTGQSQIEILRGLVRAQCVKLNCQFPQGFNIADAATLQAIAWQLGNEIQGMR